MPFRWNPHEQLSHGRYALKWLLIVAPLGVAVGSACALFLWLLDRATTTRFENPWLLYLLPLAGVPMVWIYQRFGKGSDRGNNLIVEQIHEPGGGVPARMAPLVLTATIATHLFGGSAGREGTAIQMGGSIASAYGRFIPRFNKSDTRTLLMAGVAAGFAGVFGTPLAGTIFALEVLAIGQITYTAVIPCLIAAIFSDWACTAWNIHHTAYHVAPLIHTLGGHPTLNLHGLLMLKVTLAAAAFGVASLLFAELTHTLHKLFALIIKPAVLRPLLGGAIIIALVHLLGTRDYLSIGVVSQDPNGVSIVSSFSPGGAASWSWFWKLLFTAITLSVGFKGGEVTPLFFIGAALGNTLAISLDAPVDLFAALGFVAVFAGATNTPLASTIMAVELFGPEHVVYFAVACFIAYFVSGHSGVYLSQRIGTPKTDQPLLLEPHATLHDARQQRRAWHSLLRDFFSKRPS